MEPVNKAVTIGAVIPIIPAHRKFLGSLLQNLTLMDRPFDSIVVVASGFSKSGLRSLRACVPRSAESAIQFVTTGPGSAGKNRNIGWSQIRTDLVSFLDADDTYSLDRTRVIEEIMTGSSLDALVHAFEVLTADSEISPRREEKYSLVREDVLFQATFGEQERDRNREITDPNWVSTIKTDGAGGFAVHHGHLTIRRELPVEIAYHELSEHRNEDSVFVRDILWNGLRIGASSMVLSNYRPASSGHFLTASFVWKETVSTLHRTARRFLKRP